MDCNWDWLVEDGLALEDYLAVYDNWPLDNHWMNALDQGYRLTAASSGTSRSVTAGSGTTITTSGTTIATS